jgi:hypothetical protein
MSVGRSGAVRGSNQGYMLLMNSISSMISMLGSRADVVGDALDEVELGLVVAGVAPTEDDHGRIADALDRFVEDHLVDGGGDATAEQGRQQRSASAARRSHRRSL